MSTASTEQVLDVLGYAESPNYRLTSDQHHPLTAHLFRAARDAGAEGAYLFHTSPNDEILPPRPAVYIAEAQTPEEAREIHRSLWNLGNVPFLIVVLPSQIRVYTGFNYDRQNKEKGLVKLIDQVRIRAAISEKPSRITKPMRLTLGDYGQVKPNISSRIIG